MLNNETNDKSMMMIEGAKGHVTMVMWPFVDIFYLFFCFLTHHSLLFSNFNPSSLPLEVSNLCISMTTFIVLLFTFLGNPLSFSLDLNQTLPWKGLGI